MEATFDELVTLGIYVYVGSENGEPQYVMDIKRTLELAPELYWKQRNEIDLQIMNAVSAGFMDWDIDPTTLEETLTFNA